MSRLYSTKQGTHSDPIAEVVMEGKDGIASGAGDKYITLIAQADLVQARSYSVEVLRTIYQPGTQGTSMRNYGSFVGHQVGNNWLGTNSVVNTLDSGSYNPGGDIDANFTTGQGLRLKINSHKSENLYIAWKATVVSIDATAPLLP
ncbi:MAG: hypothetical protein QGG14_00875 [Planctomycetota bacterium]|jgi:hypothetical protein|nr:hypothetical protein [Planctomycetota bacterium]